MRQWPVVGWRECSWDLMVFILCTRSRPAPGGGAGKSMSNIGTEVFMGGATPPVDDDDVVGGVEFDVLLAIDWELLI